MRVLGKVLVQNKLPSSFCKLIGELAAAQAATERRNATARIGDMILICRTAGVCD